MAYLIDGHNLIGQLSDISLDDPDDEAKLVLKLLGFAARTGKRIVVIFDKGLPGGKSPQSTSQVTVIFAPSNSDADSLMKGRIANARDPGQWTVVSGDRAVIAAARSRRMKTLSSSEFAHQLHPPAPPKRSPADIGEAAEVYVSPDEVEAWMKLFGTPEDT